MATRVKAARSRRKQHDDSLLEAEFERFKTLRIVALVSILAVTGWFVAALFAPGLRYSLATPPQASIESESFLKELEPLVNSKIARENQVQVLSNGENFYEAEIFAIRQAQHSINIEAYIFHKGEVTRRLLEVLTERSRSGVKVRLVLDSLGTLATPKRYFKSLTQAGGRVEWYHPLRWNNWFHSNNRTHRELMVIDGSVAFMGGAGFADWWRFSKKSEPRWRDTMFRVQGDAVPSLQGNFVENWLEASGGDTSPGCCQHSIFRRFYPFPHSLSDADCSREKIHLHHYPVLSAGPQHATRDGASRATRGCSEDSGAGEAQRSLSNSQFGTQCLW